MYTLKHTIMFGSPNIDNFVSIRKTWNTPCLDPLVVEKGGEFCFRKQTQDVCYKVVQYCTHVSLVVKSITVKCASQRVHLVCALFRVVQKPCAN